MKATATEKPIQRLSCCCCGEYTRGRQWWNRDTGFGLCPECAEWIKTKGCYSDEEFKSIYGIDGVHYNVEGGRR